MSKSASSAPTNPLYAALLKAQAELTAIGHDSKNAFHKYAYTSSEHMISVVRPILIKHGLLFAETDSDVKAEDGAMARVSSTFVLAHPDTGLEVTICSTQVALAEKGRPLDKAVAGARTVNIGYALRGLLNLPRGEESDTPDQRNDKDYDPNIEKLGKSLVTMCAAIDFAEDFKNIKPRQRLAKIAEQVGVTLDKNVTLADLKKVEARITQIIDSHPNMKIEDDQ